LVLKGLEKVEIRRLFAYAAALFANGGMAAKGTQGASVSGVNAFWPLIIKIV
jgi:hypothetical protein